MPKYPRMVYKITHIVTGRSYIGSTSDLVRRINGHFSRLEDGIHSVEDLQNDFDEYGGEFVISVLDVISNRNESDKEYTAMKLYGTTVRGNGYNYKDNFNPDKKVIQRKKRIKKKVVYPNVLGEMARKKLTRVELAKLMNMTPSNLGKKLIGERVITFDEAIRIKSILKTDLPLEVLFEEAI